MTDVDVRLTNALRLVYIVDRRAAADWRRLDEVLTHGVTCLWLRAPEGTGAQLHRTARDLVRRGHDHGAAVIVGDRADVALASGADGVQLGFRSPPVRYVRPWFPGWIGASCHSTEELAKAKRGGADFAVLSPVFGVPNKGAPLGIPLFGRLRAEAALPVVALGGIEPANVQSVCEAGAAGVAVIRALRDAPDAGEVARTLCGAMTPR